jgi:hypothetical protein
VTTHLTRIRYTYNEKGHRKNMMMTVAIGETIYFGIARCNNLDRFDRDRGYFIAQERAMSADQQKTLPDEFFNHGELMMRKNQLSGWCNVKDVKKVVEHFLTIDIQKPGYVSEPL